MCTQVDSSTSWQLEPSPLQWCPPQNTQASASHWQSAGSVKPIDHRPCGWAGERLSWAIFTRLKIPNRVEFFYRDWKCPRLPRTNNWMNRMNRMSVNNKCPHFIKPTSLTPGDCLPSPTLTFPKALICNNAEIRWLLWASHMTPKNAWL